MIFDGQSNTPPYFCVHGYGGSTAETFAKGHLRLFYNIETDHCYWNGSTILEEATCETTGQKVSVCVICGYENYETIPLLEHDWVIVKNATETQPGTARTVCNRNPDHIRTIEFPAHGPATEVGYVGKDGDDVFYAMYEDGTLLVFGAGEVREQAFREKLFRVNDVIIDEGITAIGRLAFSGRIGIGGSIQLPDSLKSIGAGAFADHCVTSVRFGNGLETIGSGAFSTVFTGSGSQKTIVLPDSVKTVENNAFAYCDGLEEITFGPNVETVGTQVLYCGFILKKAVFLNGNTTLAYDMAVYTPDDFTIYSYAGGSVEAFANQYGYPFVDIGTYHEYDDGVITTPATCNTPGVKTYTCTLCRDTYTEDIPATGVHNYDDGVITVYPTETTDGEIVYTCPCGFSYTDTIPATPYQDWLYTESYPTGNGQIGEHVYYTTYYDGHVSIYGEGETYPTSHYVPYDYYYHPIGGNPTSIEVHEGVTGLMCKGMFCNYPQLEYVKLPASLTYIESMVFDTIQVLTAVDVAAANPSYTSQNGILFNKDMTELLLYPSGKTENSYTVPDGVEIIGEMAFHKNPVLKTVTLPDSVKEIGNTAFNSSVLETVNLGNGLETIERFAFSNCKNLESIRIPTSVKFIGRGVFQFDDNFKNVYFTCTQAEWDAIEIGEWNEPLQEANRTYGGHTYDEGVITTPATCGEAGVRTYTCIYCGGTRTETIPATGEHAYNGGVITTPATCEADGVKAFTCTGCGGSYTETIPATGHDWSDWIVTRPATETREGEAYRFCKNDPSHVEHMTIDKLPTTYEEEQSLGDRIMDWLRDFFDKIGELFQSLFIFW